MEQRTLEALKGIQKMRQVGCATLILGDCYSVLEQDFPDGWRETIVTDNPYGMKNNTDYRRFSGGKKAHARRADGTGGVKYPPVHGDSKPFDPEPFLLAKHVILWGFNHFNQRVPNGGALVWVKRKPEAFGSFLSDAEIAWEKGRQGVYCFTSYPQAMARERYHPTQKPVDLMEWCVKRTEGEVLDPFMGSGTTAVACLNLGRPFVGIEIVPEYFEISCERAIRAVEQRSLFGSRGS